MIGLGRRIYGLGAILLGIVEMAYGSISPDWLPISSHLPGYPILAHGAARVLLVAGLAIDLPRAAQVAALVLAAWFALGMAVFELPHAIIKPADWGGWQQIAESTAMALGGVLAWSQTPGVTANPAIGRMVRSVFGVCLLIFGGSHFVYAKYTASLVPAWLPPSQVL